MAALDSSREPASGILIVGEGWEVLPRRREKAICDGVEVTVVTSGQGRTQQ